MHLCRVFCIKTPYFYLPVRHCPPNSAPVNRLSIQGVALITDKAVNFLRQFGTNTFHFHQLLLIFNRTMVFNIFQDGKGFFLTNTRNSFKLRLTGFVDTELAGRCVDNCCTATKNPSHGSTRHLYCGRWPGRYVCCT